MSASAGTVALTFLASVVVIGSGAAVAHLAGTTVPCAIYGVAA